MHMPTIGERLKRSRERKGWSQLYVAQKTGISNFNISNYERGTRQPDTDSLAKLAALYDVSIDWLVNGVHARDKLPIDNKSDLSDNSTHKDKHTNGYAATGLGIDSFPMGRLVNVPIVAEISCGEPIFTEDNIIGMFPVDSSIVPISSEGELVWVRAVGDSMINANITDGSLVLLHLQPEVENGEIAAVCVDSENATLKRVYVSDSLVTLVPENPSMRPEVYEKKRIRVVAKAIWVSTKL